jgi:hypothetical protein
MPAGHPPEAIRPTGRAAGARSRQYPGARPGQTEAGPPRPEKKASPQTKPPKGEHRDGPPHPPCPGGGGGHERCGSHGDGAARQARGWGSHQDKPPQLTPVASCARAVFGGDRHPRAQGDKDTRIRLQRAPKGAARPGRFAPGGHFARWPQTNNGAARPGRFAPGGHFPRWPQTKPSCAGFAHGSLFPSGSGAPIIYGCPGCFELFSCRLHRGLLYN